jgi:hypothetical protein
VGLSEASCVFDWDALVPRAVDDLHRHIQFRDFARRIILELRYQVRLHTRPEAQPFRRIRHRAAGHEFVENLDPFFRPLWRKVLAELFAQNLVRPPPDARQGDNGINLPLPSGHDGDQGTQAVPHDPDP